MEKTQKLPWLIRDPRFYRRIFLLALPLAGQNIISFFVNMADNIMVARLGDAAVSGIYVVNQVQNILHMLVLGLSSALVILAAQYFGKKDMRSVKTLCATVLRIAFSAGFLVFLIMAFFGENVLYLFTDKAEAVAAGMEYLKYILYTYVFFCLSNVLLACLRSAGVVHIGFMVALFTSVLDLFLNYVMIFGKLGFPAMGVAGAAASTLISRALEFLILAFYVLKMDKKLSLRVKDLLLRSSRLLKDFFLYGAPVILGDIFWGLGGAAQTAILGRLDGAVISAGAITMSIYMVFTVMVYGISSAGSLVVGQEIGQNGFDLAKRYTKTLQLVYLSVGICSSLLLFLLADKALLLYPGITAEAKVYAGRFLNIMGIMLIGTSYQMASLQIVRAGGATHFVLINDLIFVWLVVIPSASLAAFVFKTPPEVVFACLKCDQILKCFVAVVKVNRFKWMKNLTQTRLEPNKTPA